MLELVREKCISEFSIKVAKFVRFLMENLVCASIAVMVLLVIELQNRFLRVRGCAAGMSRRIFSLCEIWA